MAWRARSKALESATWAVRKPTPSWRWSQSRPCVHQHHMHMDGGKWVGFFGGTGARDLSKARAMRCKNVGGGGRHAGGDGQGAVATACERTLFSPPPRTGGKDEVLAHKVVPIAVAGAEGGGPVLGLHVHHGPHGVEEANPVLFAEGAEFAAHVARDEGCGGAGRAVGWTSGDRERAHAGEGVLHHLARPEPIQ